MQYLFFNSWIFRRYFFEYPGIFLAEPIELHRLKVWRRVEGTLDRIRILIIVVEVIRENQKLGDVHESAKRWILETDIDAISLGKHSLEVIWLLYFNECQGHTVDEDRDIGAEFVLAVPVRQLGDNIKGIIVKILEVDKLAVEISCQSIEKSLSEIFVVELRGQL
jgi:hypothetical protein